ncbi:MAG: hypothetical protein ABR985_07370 [Methanotrichaceae archaeon]|jgi:hypothetical protein
MAESKEGDERMEKSDSIHSELKGMALNDDLLGFIRDNEPVTCIDIAEHFGTGSHGIFAAPGCIISYGLAEELNVGLLELLTQGKIIEILCQPGIYSGFAPGIPIATELRDYEDEHWLPVLFVTMEWVEDDLEDCKGGVTITKNR